MKADPSVNDLETPVYYPHPGRVCEELPRILGRGARGRSGAGFHGELTNVNVSGEPGIDHFTIDKSPRLQALVMKSVLQAASAQSCRPGADAPVPHAAAPLRRGAFEGLVY